MREFFAFRRMVTPGIIHIVFVAGVLMCVVLGLRVIALGWSWLIEGLAIIVIGPLVLRIGCEVVILMFRISRSLIHIQEHTAPRPAEPEAPPPDEPPEEAVGQRVS